MKTLNRLFGKKEKYTNNICCSESEFREKLKIERSRTHRNAHEFSLVLFKLKPMRLGQEKINRMVQTISSRIRDIDNIGWYDKYHIGVILPYTSSTGAEGFVNTIIQSLNGTGQDMEYTLYTYPPEKKMMKENTKRAVLRN